MKNGKHLLLQKLANGSIFATIINGKDMISDVKSNATESHQTRYEDPDPKGAVIYVVAVILIYGISIVFMIGSSVRKKSNQQSYVDDIFKDLTKAEKMQEKQES